MKVWIDCIFYLWLVAVEVLCEAEIWVVSGGHGGVVRGRVWRI